MAFSAAVIAGKWACPRTVAIASDNFHQLRAAIWAERSGLTPYSAGCASPWFLTAGYWAREAAALLYMVCTGSCNGRAAGFRELPSALKAVFQHVENGLAFFHFSWYNSAYNLNGGTYYGLSDRFCLRQLRRLR